MLGIETRYKLESPWLLVLGAELQSGNDGGVPTKGKNNAFTPLYGTNHKFNGWMNYFYVGNHANNVGLFDLYAAAQVEMESNSKLQMALHHFSAAAKLTQNVSKSLGTEFDLTYSYILNTYIKFSGGYSHKFASEGMEVLKNNFDGNTNN